MLVLDIRHPLKDYDLQMLHWASTIGLPVHALLTKADKLKKGPACSTLLKVRAAMLKISPTFSAQTFSSLRHSGIDEAHAKLDEWLGLQLAAITASPSPAE